MKIKLIKQNMSAYIDNISVEDMLELWELGWFIETF
jgi:hypothetical protein